MATAVPSSSFEDAGTDEDEADGKEDTSAALLDKRILLLVPVLIYSTASALTVAGA